MIICLGTTPAVQRVMVFRKLEIGEVNRAVEVHQDVAGKSINVVKVLSALGKKVYATGFAGGARGKFILDKLEAMGLRPDFVWVDEETRLCVTILDQDRETITELVEESKPVKAENWETLLDQFKVVARGDGIVILSGTLAGGVAAPVGFYRDCVASASAANVRCIVDTQGTVLLETLKADPFLVKPNRKELGLALGVSVESDSSLQSAMIELVERGAKNSVITLGAEGAMAFDGKEFWYVTSPKVKAVNSVGSGDAFTAGLAAALVDGQNLAEACRLGAACGAANAMTLMAGDVRAEDVKSLLEQTSVRRV